MTAFDPTVDSSENTYTNSDKTAERTVTGNRSWAVSTTTKSAGKHYFETIADVSSGSFHGVGVFKTGYNTAVDMGQNADEVCYFANGNRYNEGSFGSFGATWTTGDIIGVELDLAGQTVEFFKNGASQGGGAFSVTFSAGDYHCGVQLYTQNDKSTGRWISADQTYTPTAGFLPWGAEAPAALEGDAQAGYSNYVLRSRTAAATVDADAGETLTGIVGRFANILSAGQAGAAWTSQKVNRRTAVGAAQASSAYGRAGTFAQAVLVGGLAGESISGRIPFEVYYSAATVVRAVLTGSADSLPDLPLSITSFSAAVRVNGEDYASIVVPNTSSVAADIAARPNGDINIYVGARRNDGLEELVELVTVNLEEVRPDRGPRSYKHTLAGHKSNADATPISISVPGAIYSTIIGGSKRVRTAGIAWLPRPGDTVTTGGETFVSNTINYYGTRNQAATEFAEL